MSGRRTTLARAVSVRGRGVHTGTEVQLTLEPASPGTGRVFVRADLPDAPVVPATFAHAVASDRATTLGAGAARVQTVEHLLAALSGLEYDDVVCRLDGSEVPILDGSAAPFVALLVEAGRRAHGPERNPFVVDAVHEVCDGDRWLRWEPAPRAEVAMTVDFSDRGVPKETFEAALDPGVFARDVAPARTFALADEVEALRARGLVRGGSLACALVVEPGGAVRNPEGRRFSNELARHKALDAVGDLALHGRQWRGRLTGFRSGHALTHRLLRRAISQLNSRE